VTVSARRLREEQGAVAIVVAVCLIVLMAAVALTVDVGGLYLRRRELVNGSDAAALSAARTCARGGVDDRFTTPEEAADAGVRRNATITTDEVAGTNITYLPAICGQQWGRVSVRYTSQQSLHFAPVLGFGYSSPVTTEATASWGLGSNNPLPIVVSSLLAVSCPVPPSGFPTQGDRCVFWYDNDRLNGGNFAFLSLNPQGWNVPADGNCAGAGQGGTSRLTDWIEGSLPASVVLNWTDPTYVCTDTGIRGVGGDSGPNSQLWSALEDLIGETRDFPINWEGPGQPIPTAPSQGTIYQNGNIDKYDIIGFASMTIVDVLNVNEASGGEGTCTTRNNSPYAWTQANQTLQLDSVDATTAGWQGCPQRTPADAITTVAVTQAKPNDPPCCVLGFDYTYDPATRTITWLGAVPRDTKITFGWLLDPNNGPCGPVPPNNSAMCVITEWQSSTLDDDFPPGTDNNTVVRLCDPEYGTCLDQ
jgi:Flp pilus assembly protein TadG